MVTRVEAPTDYYLMNSAGNILANTANEQLVSYSIFKLRELKQVTANFKNGFMFSDTYYAKNEIRKLFRIIAGNFLKEIPHLKGLEGLSGLTRPFIEINSNSSSIKLYCFRDPSLDKYIDRIIEKFNLLRIPCIIEKYNYGQEGVVISLTLSLMNSRSSSSLNLYKLIQLIPEGMTILRTLSRKALFENVNYQYLTRSFRSPVPNSGDTSGNT